MQSHCCDSCRPLFSSISEPSLNIEQELIETKLALTEALYEKQELVRHVASLKKNDVHPLISTIKENSSRTRVN